MHVFTTGLAAVRRRPGSGLPFLVISGLLWGTGGLTGSLLGREAGLSAIAVAAYRLAAGGLLIAAFRAPAGRPWPARRAAWTRIAVIGLLAAFYQSCYFTAVSLTSVPLATLVTIGSAPVIVLAASRVTGRPAGRHAAATTALAVTGLGLLVRLALRVRRDRGTGQRGHGRAGRGGLRRDHLDRLPAGAGSGRPHRDRFRLH